MKTKKNVKKSVEKQETKGNSKPVEKKASAKKASIKKASVEKDDYGFKKDSKSSSAVKLLAGGKVTAKEIRKQFKTLSFGKLLLALNAHGFKVVEDKKDGFCSVVPSKNAPKVQNKGQVEAKP